MDLDIYNLYNLNIINLNNLINNKIFVDISNFLYDNNLIDLYYKSKDYKKIILIDDLSLIKKLENFNIFSLYDVLKR